MLLECYIRSGHFAQHPHWNHYILVYFIHIYLMVFVVWGNAGKAENKKIKSLQKKAIKAIDVDFSHIFPISLCTLSWSSLRFCCSWHEMWYPFLILNYSYYHYVVFSYYYYCFYSLHNMKWIKNICSKCTFMKELHHTLVWTVLLLALAIGVISMPDTIILYFYIVTVIVMAKYISWFMILLKYHPQGDLHINLAMDNVCCLLLLHSPMISWLLVTGYWLLVIGYWLLVTGYWLLVISYWLLVIGKL